MKYYIEESINSFDEEISMTVFSPAQKGLQNTDESSTRPEKKDTDILHYIVAKILWVKKRGRTDTEPAILLISTRVTKSTK